MAIYLGVFYPSTRRLGSGFRVVGGRLWVTEAGMARITAAVLDRHVANPSVSHSQTPLHPRPIATRERV